MMIGLLGMGTIGSGVFEIAQGLEGVRVKKVLERRFQAEYITDNIEEIVSDPEIKLVVETMGGLHPAYEFAAQAISHGKHFVTANKLLVSAYGPELTKLAKENGVAFLYGAACGGGIAYLANLEIARGIDRITALGGILNGTTNYILDSMQSRNMDYAQALSEAQALGYAERDPSSDVDGLDTMRKLILACAVGFDAYVKPEEIPTFGISAVLPADIAYARAHGLTLRLCEARRGGRALRLRGAHAGSRRRAGGGHPLQRQLRLVSRRKLRPDELHRPGRGQAAHRGERAAGRALRGGRTPLHDQRGLRSGPPGQRLRPPRLLSARARGRRSPRRLGCVEAGRGCLGRLRSEGRLRRRSARPGREASVRILRGHLQGVSAYAEGG